MSAKHKSGKITPVEALPPKTTAIKSTLSTSRPLMPALEKPIIKAANIIKTHCKIENSRFIVKG
jgi:hypothetical protein